MTDIASDLKGCFDDFVYGYLSAWEYDPQTVIKNNMITGRDPERENHEDRLIEVLEKLRDSVDSIPPAILTKTEKSRATIGPKKYEELLVSAIRGIGVRTIPQDASEFLHSLLQSPA